MQGRNEYTKILEHCDSDDSFTIQVNICDFDLVQLVLHNAFSRFQMPVSYLRCVIYVD